MGQVDDLDVGRVGERGTQILRLWHLPPLELRVHDVGAERLRHAGPALAEVAGGEDELPVARRCQVRDCRLERARAGGRVHENVVLCAVDLRESREAALVHVAVAARAVVDDRLGERREHLRRHGRRARRQQVPLLGHMAETSGVGGR